MKKFLLAMCVAFVAIACTVDDTTPIQPDSLGNDVPTIIHASVDAQMRSELQWEDDAPKSYWSVGDKIAVFNALPNYNAYELDSDEPCHDGDFKLIEGSEIKGAEDGFEFAETVAFYPYADNLTLQSGENESAVLKFVVPATQLFVESDSYCETSNPMVAVEMAGDYAFKNLFGFLKVTLTGSETIKKITLKGNNGEILAGDCEANIADYSVVMDDNGSTELTIDCGEGVELNEEGISFIFSLPPMTFKQGFTIEAIDSESRCFTISTTNEVAITRNAIQPMDAIASSEAAVSCIIDAEAMTAEQLNAAVAKALDYGITAISVNLAEDADATMFSAITAALAADGIEEGSIDLTISGAKTVPEYGFFDYGDYFENDEKNIAGDKLKSLTLTDVETIGKYAFSACTNLEAVNMPNVVTIGKFAFNEYTKGTKLTSLDLPNATTIGESAFAYSSLLTSVNLPKMVTIGVQAFDNCDIRTLDLPEVTEIGGGAFMYNYNLVSCSAPKVTTIGFYPWGNCSRLETLELTAAGDFTLSNNLFANTPTGQINLVLNIDKTDNVSEDNWTYKYIYGERELTQTITFKSITFVGE